MTDKNDWDMPDHEIPEAASRYMKLEQGKNRFRMLSKPLIGWEGWISTKDGKRPVRVDYSESIDISKVDDPEQTKYFWAFPVWNYKTKSVQVLSLTQKTILKVIKGLWKNKEWGSPGKYDINIVRAGEGMNTEYETVPSPHKELSEEVEKEWARVKENFDITRLLTNEDPFGEGLTQSDYDRADREIEEEF